MEKWKCSGNSSSGAPNSNVRGTFFELNVWTLSLYVCFVSNKCYVAKWMFPSQLSFPSRTLARRTGWDTKVGCVPELVEKGQFSVASLPASHWQSDPFVLYLSTVKLSLIWQGNSQRFMPVCRCLKLASFYGPRAWQVGVLFCASVKKIVIAFVQVRMSIKADKVSYAKAAKALCQSTDGPEQDKVSNESGHAMNPEAVEQTETAPSSGYFSYWV